MGNKKSKIKNQENLQGPTAKAAQDNQNKSAGLNGNFITEPVPFYEKTETEKVIKNKNNSWIVLGRDRPSTPASGYGGQGGTQCASIDLVAGRMSSVEGGPKSNTWVSPNFESDAARIYISQRTDIDENFGLVEGGVGISKAKSGIGIKADAIRIIGREGIKLVTNTDAKNSQGKDIISTKGIDLIAGNWEADLSGPLASGDFNFIQPIVKGENLVAAIDELATQLGDLATRFNKFAQAQVKYNTQLALHYHPNVPPLPPTLPSPEVGISFLENNIKQFTNATATAFSQQKNISSYKTNYLQPSGDRWICSRWNRTT